jgi:excisionase family DNA binding protein
MGELVVTLTTEQLRQLVASAVNEVAEKSNQKEVLTSPEVAELLQVNEALVARMVLKHGLPAHRLSPRVLRFLRSEVLAFVKANPLAQREAS